MKTLLIALCVVCAGCDLPPPRPACHCPTVTRTILVHQRIGKVTFLQPITTTQQQHTTACDVDYELLKRKEGK